MGPYRLRRSLGYSLSQAAGLQGRRREEGLRELGLTRTSWRILLAVGNENFSRPSEIAAFVGVDRTATSRALTQMQNGGLIERDQGEGDRRTTHVVLTEKGRDCLTRGEPIARENDAAICARLSPDESRKLFVPLDKLLNDDPSTPETR